MCRPRARTRARRTRQTRRTHTQAGRGVLINSIVSELVKQVVPKAISAGVSGVENLFKRRRRRGRGLKLAGQGKRKPRGRPRKKAAK